MQEIVRLEESVNISANIQSANIQLNILTPERQQEKKQEIKQQIRQRLKETLNAAKEKPNSERQSLIRQSLLQLQAYCKSLGNTFIFYELKITCDQYDLGGSASSPATLFRGPSENASVAICVTDQGSLLHRNGQQWHAYCDAGDVMLNRYKEPTSAFL
ncbi:MAG: hypothetical protein AAFR25_06945 [Cyanobacteria bacterium J06629_19]